MIGLDHDRQVGHSGSSIRFASPRIHSYGSYGHECAKTKAVGYAGIEQRCTLQVRAACVCVWMPVCVYSWSFFNTTSQTLQHVARGMTAVKYNSSRRRIMPCIRTLHVWLILYVSGRGGACVRVWRCALGLWRVVVEACAVIMHEVVVVRSG